MSYIYDVSYGIHDHGQVLQPLAQVLMNEKENYGPNTPHSKSSRDYRRYKIKEYGLSLFDWYDLPLAEAEALIELAKEYMETEASIQTAAENNLNNLINKKP